jgi:large subunit ribosomal protein L10
VPTQEKVATVEDFKGRLDGVKTVVLTEYRGLSVRQMGELRRQLRAVSAQYKVIKNRLARLVVASSDLDGLGEHLRGPTGIVLSGEDPVAVAKALQAFARTNQALQIKAGFVEGKVLSADGIRALADLPSREALRAQLVGAIQAPLQKLLGLLTGPQRDLVYVLAERGKGAGEASAPAETPKED